MDAFARQLKSSPDLLPHSYDAVRDAALLIEMTQQAYADASFLDGRIVTPQTRGRWVAAEPLTALFTDAPKPACRFIFHIGHVGSTLLSRLLGAVPSVLALREPQALRTLAELMREVRAPESLVSSTTLSARIDAFLKAWSRTYAPGQASIIKATSFVAEIAPDLLARTEHPAIAMFAPAENYLAAILGGENSTIEVLSTAPMRLKRLHTRLGAAPWRLAGMGLGERVAMSWACEMVALGAADGPVLKWLDFDAFLAAPAAELAACFAHLGVTIGPGDPERIAAGPLMSRYSKAPEHAYSAELRRQVLDGARKSFAEEIHAGLTWLTLAARDWPEIAGALERGAG